MKKRSSIITISILIMALPFGCAKKETAPETTSQAAPALPGDVKDVAAAATTAATETGGAAVASAESGGTIVATGELISPVRSELAVKLPGRVAKMYVEEGTRISRGQALLELETDYPRLNLEKAQADIARAESAEQDAQRDLNRKKELIGKESIPQATFDRSQAMYDQAHANKQSMQAQANIYRQQMADSTLRSPIDGVVAEKRTDVGQRLGDATVALVVVQTSPLKLRFRVPEKELPRVRNGQNVKATVDAYPGDVFQGRVAMVGGVVDPATRSFTVETEFANRDGKLRPGMFARVEMAQ